MFVLFYQQCHLMCTLIRNTWNLFNRENYVAMLSILMTTGCTHDKILQVQSDVEPLQDQRGGTDGLRFMRRPKWYAPRRQN